MHAVPIPDDVLDAWIEQHGHAARIVIGESDPTRDDVRPCEYLLTASSVFPGQPCVTALVELTDADRAAIAAGARLTLTMDGGEAPWTLAVLES